MNQQQKIYAVERIKQVEKIKKSDAHRKFTTRAINLTSEEKYKLISSGKVKVLSYSQCKSQYGRGFHELDSCFDFSKHEEKEKLDIEKYQPICQRIEALAEEARDQIMLGDSQEALKLIRELELLKI